MSRPKKYGVRAEITITVADRAGRELVDRVPVDTAWIFFGSRQETLEFIYEKIEGSFRRLEHELDRVVFRGVRARPVGIRKVGK